MVKSTRREYLETIRKRYRKARKKDKKPILDEFCANCGYHRKYAIRLLSLRPRSHGRRPGAKPIYDSAALLVPLKRIWFATIRCARRSSRPPFCCGCPTTSRNMARCPSLSGRAAGGVRLDIPAVS